ncbi:MAG: thioredoxin family protein, partial [Planctomycetota bacterium]
MKKNLCVGFFFFIHLFFAQDNNRILEPALESLNLGVDLEQTQYAILKSINHYPQTVKAYLALGRFYFNQEKYAEALFNFFQAHQNAPTHCTPQAYLADFYMRCGLLTQAAPYLDFCLKAGTVQNLARDPRDLSKLIQLWQAKREILNNHFDEARQRLAQNLKENESHPMNGDAYRLLLQIAEAEKNETEQAYFKNLVDKSARTFLNPIDLPLEKPQIYFQYVNTYHAYGSFLYAPVMRWAQFEKDGTLSIPQGNLHFSSGVNLLSDKNYQIGNTADLNQVEIWFVSHEGIESNKVVVQVGQGVAKIFFSRLQFKQTQVSPNGRADFHITATNSLGKTYFKDTFYWWAQKEGQDVTRKVLHRTRSFSPNTFENHRITFFAPKKQDGESWAGKYEIFVSDQPKEEKGVVASVEVFVDFSQPNEDKLLVEYPGGIEWERTSFEESLQKAQKEQKPLFILATAAWCPFCRRFENGTLQKEEVITASRKFVCVIVDIERQRDLVQRWDI